MVSEETFKVGIAKFPRLVDVGQDEKGGGEPETTAANGLEQPEGGETGSSAVKHRRYFTLVVWGMVAVRRRKPSISRKDEGLRGKVDCGREGVK